jgi:hypothetical protein
MVKNIPKNKIILKQGQIRDNQTPKIPSGLSNQQYHIRRRCPYIWLENSWNNYEDRRRCKTF